MNILLIQIELHLPASQSLKDKRRELQSIKDRLKANLNVAVAEIDEHDKWQLAVLGVVTISNLRDRVEKTSRQVIEEIEKNFDVVVTGVNEQWL